jgi:CubicO group peptidase (beta-lactamase class C family)
MLLSHTSSIKDSNVYSQYYTLNQTPVLPDSPIPLGEYLKDYLSPGGKLYNAKDNFLVAAPGTTYTYTNTGFGLVGYLTERISGIPFDQYCKQAVFEPLGMQHSAWFFKDVNTNRMAIPYGYNDLLRQPKRFGFYGYPTYPDGALKTSVNEFARFLSVFINEGKTFEGETFLQPETVREMLAPHHFPGMDSGTSVGVAWHFDGDNYFHDGGDPGIDTYTFFNPNTDKGVIFFSNGTDVSSSSPPTIIRGLYFEILIPTLLTTKMNNP